MVVDISPNWNIMLWAIFVIWFIGSVPTIIHAINHYGEAKKYDCADIFVGILTLVLVILILFA